MAPPQRHDRSLEKATKNKGSPFWASSDERVDCGPPRPLTLYSPALRVGAGKSGVGGGEWKVSSMQISVLFNAKSSETCSGLPPVWERVISPECTATSAGVG